MGMFIRSHKKLILLILSLWTFIFVFRFLLINNLTKLILNDKNDFIENSINYLYETTTKAKSHGSLLSNDYALNIDNSSVPNEKDVIFMNISNIPNINWEKMRSFQKYSFEKSKLLSNTCRVFYPNPYELSFNNIYWQFFQSDNTMFYLYGAYYDDRPLGGKIPKIRIISMINKINPPPTICQLWFHNFPSPIPSRAKYTFAWHPKWGNFKDGILQPFIITCEVPQLNINKHLGVPISVSLVKNPCDNSTNNLRINNFRPPKVEQFAVCVKGLDFLYTDLSIRLIEWIELIRILGASKIFFYDLESHPNMKKVLKFYEKQGFVQLTTLTLPGSQPNIPGFRHWYLKKKLTNKRQNELIPYNDCLYKNLYTYKYLVLLDIDEIIMPLVHQNWSDLMDHVEKISHRSSSSYNVRNVYFFDDFVEKSSNDQLLNHQVHEQGIPRYFHMLQHVYRSSNFTKPGQYVKSFHNVNQVVSLHNHFPLNCFGSCTTYPIDTSLAQLQHYRKDCVVTLKSSCNSNFKLYPVRDTAIYKYKDQLIQRVTDALQVLGFFT